jgi:serine/threonine-protein kinase HipA
LRRSADAVRELTLDVRLDSFAEPIGVLVRDSTGALAFAYTASHLRNHLTHPLSLSLPLTDEPFGDAAARSFFDNLLPERNEPLAELMARERIRRDDIAGLLLHLGKDCAGALSVLPSGAPPVKGAGDLAQDYLPFSRERLSKITFALHGSYRLPAGMAYSSPLSGMQSKIAVTQLPDGRLAEPKPGSGAPTTHILKVPDRKHRGDSQREYLTLQIARDIGLESAEATVFSFDEVDALLVARFDRALDADGRVVRLHQEDFAQALGLPPQLKYERQGTPDRRFDVPTVRRILDATAYPAAERLRFILNTMFDLLIGNTEGHAKNLGLLYDRGRWPRLAPRYDLLPTRLDPTHTDELAFRIGEADRLSDLTGAQFDSFLRALGIVTVPARRRIRKDRVKPLADSLTGALPSIAKLGFKTYADLIAANIHALETALGLETVEAANAHDALVEKDG